MLPERAAAECPEIKALAKREGKNFENPGNALGCRWWRSAARTPTAGTTGRRTCGSGGPTSGCPSPVRRARSCTQVRPRHADCNDYCGGATCRQPWHTTRLQPRIAAARQRECPMSPACAGLGSSQLDRSRIAASQPSAWRPSSRPCDVTLCFVASPQSATHSWVVSFCCSVAAACGTQVGRKGHRQRHNAPRGLEVSGHRTLCQIT